MSKIGMALAILVLGTTAAFGDGIKFEKGDLASVLKKAKKEHKIVFIDAYAVWCSPCKAMDAKTFKDNSVGAFFKKNVTAFKVDVEKGEGPGIKEKYSISGLPGYVFLDSDGAVVFREAGFKSVEEFLEIANKAKAYAEDPNSVGRLEARYPKEKSNEAFLKLYINTLKDSNKGEYYEVLEQYLKVQKSMDPSSSEMALFLNDHRSSIVYGGVAEDIIKNNLYSDGWKKVVRKKVRENFQLLPQQMLSHTVQYSIKLRDTSMLLSTVKKANVGRIRNLKYERNQLLAHFYFNTNDGKNYKAYARPEIEKLYSSLNVKSLREKHLEAQQMQANNPNNKRMISHAMRNSEELLLMIVDYAKFVDSDSDKKDVLKWSQRVYELYPENWKNVNFYANILHNFGDSSKALDIKEQALKMSGGSDKERVQLELDQMKKGEPISITKR